MPAPAESRPETNQTNAPSGRSDRDDTVAVEAASSSDIPAVPGFGSPAAPNEVGSLGPYRVVKELGKGGMGAVYAAIDTRLERRLALKVMLPEFVADAAAKERFLREARAAAKISHDNVVTVYEADERQGVPYIAMQFLEGYPLDEYLKKKGKPTIQQVLRIAMETAAGLAAAHKIGLVHRDIKPGNLWLESPHGRVKVLDFGLAKPLDAEVELTKSGAVVGTPAYMSPEQARGQKVDHRTDLFSLGSVLYRLCTGRLPFQGPTTMAVLMALGIEEPPPVRELNPQVPESLAALIHQLLSKRADARPQSAMEVVKRVRAISQELTAPRAHSAELSTSHPQMVQPQVVYVPIQVTALPSAENPFADLDAPSTEMPRREVAESSAAPPEPKPERKKPGGKGMWVAAGLAVALAAAVVAGVIIVIKNKDGTETKIEVPDGSTVTVKDKNGKTLAKVGPGGKQPVPDTSPDRKAAEWVLSVGGSVHVNGEERNIIAADLPKERFTLTWVSLHGAKVTDAILVHFKGLQSLTFLNLDGMNVSEQDLVHLKERKSLATLVLYNTPTTDAGLVHLKELKSLTYLSLAATPVTDAGLAYLKELKGLTVLVLGSLKVTDAGLAHLKEIKGLTILRLGGSAVSDAGLAHLKELKMLTLLDVRNTKVTAKGLADFHAAVPGCKIDHDGGVIEAVDVDRKAAEWVIAQGGSVQVNGGGKDIKAAAELPKERFSLASVILRGTKVSNEDLMHLRELRSLEHLDLNGTQVSDAGLEHLKEFRSLARLGLNGTQVSDAGLAHLKAIPSLTLLDLGYTRVSDMGLAQLKEFKNLAWLDLVGTRVTDAGLEHLKKLKNLTHLDVRKTKAMAKGVAEFHAAVPACKIEHDGGVIEAVDVDRKAAEWVIAQGGFVRINGEDKDRKAVADLPKDRFTLTLVWLASTKVTDAGLVHLKDLKSLTVLALDGTKVTDAGLVHLKELKMLTVLALDGTKVADAGLVHLKELKNLTSLHLPSTQVGDAGLVHLKELKSLATLVLYNTPIKDAGLAHFKELKGLTSLNLGATLVTDAGLVHLKDLKSLTFFVLDGTRVTDAGLAHLKDCKALTRLYLGGTRVTDVGLEHLKELKSLTSLDLRKTKVMAKGLETFHAALPACRIEHDGGVIEAVDVDRKAAEWVISLGGFISVNNRQIKAAADLPKEQFALGVVSLDGAKVTDAGLAQLSNLTGLAGLNLNGTQVSDAGLVHLKRIKSLTGLHLNGTKVTDAGLAHLSELKGLQVLTLQGTSVTDEGLKLLHEFKALTGLNVVGTKVTAKGLAEFHAAVPGCRIDHDGGTIEPKK